MGLNTRLEKDLKDKEKKRRQQPEDEETMEYLEPLAFLELNTYKGVFEDPNKGNSLNDRPSVFDRQAVFHVGTEQE